MFSKSILLSASLASLALAKTDLSGCTTTNTQNAYGEASVAWYVPGTGELCDPLDCGGGRAPPKTDVPGCAAYSGTATYSPSYLPGWSSATATSEPSVISDYSTISGADTSSTTFDLYTTAPISQTGTPSAIIDTIRPTSGSPSAIIDTVRPTSNYGTPSAIIDTIRPTSATAAPTTSAAPANNGTMTGGHNATAPTSSPTSTMSLSGAIPTAQAWMNGAGLLVGLGAIAAML